MGLSCQQDHYPSNRVVGGGWRACARSGGGGEWTRGQAEAERKEQKRGKRIMEEWKWTGGRTEKRTVRKQRQKEKRVTEADSAAEHRSCGEQADATYQSKHTAGLPWEEANSGGATSLSLLAPSHHASQPACRQLHPSNLLLSTTFSRKTASHYPEQGVCADGQTPDQSAGFPVRHPLLLDPAYRGSTPRSVWHLNFHFCFQFSCDWVY